VWNIITSSWFLESKFQGEITGYPQAHPLSFECAGPFGPCSRTLLALGLSSNCPTFRPVSDLFAMKLGTNVMVRGSHLNFGIVGVRTVGMIAVLLSRYSLFIICMQTDMTSHCAFISCKEYITYKVLFDVRGAKIVFFFL
jgi:hypothetical protein